MKHWFLNILVQIIVVYGIVISGIIVTKWGIEEYPGVWTSVMMMIITIGIIRDERFNWKRRMAVIIAGIAQIVMYKVGEVLIIEWIKVLFWYALVLYASIVWQALILNWVYVWAEKRGQKYIKFLVSRMSILTSWVIIEFIIKWGYYMCEIWEEYKQEAYIWQKDQEIIHSKYKSYGEWEIHEKREFGNALRKTHQEGRSTYHKTKSKSAQIIQILKFILLLMFLILKYFRNVYEKLVEIMIGKEVGFWKQGWRVYVKIVLIIVISIIISIALQIPRIYIIWIWLTLWWVTSQIEYYRKIEADELDSRFTKYIRELTYGNNNIFEYSDKELYSSLNYIKDYEFLLIPWWDRLTGHGVNIYDWLLIFNYSKEYELKLIMLRIGIYYSKDKIEILLGQKNKWKKEVMKRFSQGFKEELPCREVKLFDKIFNLIDIEEGYYDRPIISFTLPLETIYTHLTYQRVPGFYKKENWAYDFSNIEKKKRKKEKEKRKN